MTESGEFDKPTISTLTDREKEVLVLLAEGKLDKEIAELLHISPKTVSFHCGRIYRKLDISCRTAAANWAFQSGLVSKD